MEIFQIQWLSKLRETGEIQLNGLQEILAKKSVEVLAYKSQRQHIVLRTAASSNERGEDHLQNFGRKAVHGMF